MDNTHKGNEPSIFHVTFENAKTVMAKSLEQQTYQFLKALGKFDYALSSLDRIWEVLFKGSGQQWNYLYISKYQKTYFINHVNGESGTLEVEPEKSVKVMESGAFSNARPFYPEEELMEEWRQLLSAAGKWLKLVEKDWIKANKQVQEEYPLKYRYGAVPHSLVRESIPGAFRLDKTLGKSKARKLTRLVEEGYFMNRENTIATSMTAAKYFEYCRIAYLAAARKEDEVAPSLSGREMYKLYADGRHDGLLDIDPDSEQEFSDWIDHKHPKWTGGGHPWEIKRGGNTTHIDLSVRRPDYYSKEGFVVEVNGPSIIRMVEAMKMFLAIHGASLPISIAEPESVRKRLLGQDNVGIIPEYASLHRANQRFHPEEDVFEVMYYEDLGRYKRRITPFIRWEALPMLRLRDV